MLTVDGYRTLNGVYRWYKAFVRSKFYLHSDDSNFEGRNIDFDLLHNNTNGAAQFLTLNRLREERVSTYILSRELSLLKVPRWAISSDYREAACGNTGSEIFSPGWTGNILDFDWNAHGWKTVFLNVQFLQSARSPKNFRLKAYSLGRWGL